MSQTKYHLANYSFYSINEEIFHDEYIYLLFLYYRILPY